MKNISEILPRAELKQLAKQKMRGHWKTILLMTFLYMVFIGLLGGSQYAFNPDPTVMSSNSPMAQSMIFKMFGLSMGLSIIGGILVSGVYGYCYTAWFVALANNPTGAPLTFSNFMERFSDAVRGILAYIWQNIWLTIWSLLAVPGYTLLIVGIFTETKVLGILGVLLMIAGSVVAIIRAIRYQFIYHVLADCQNKIGVRRALRHSIEMTKDQVGALFVAGLSFIPWLLLIPVTAGFILFYLVPYISESFALIYVWLRDKAFEEGRLSPEEFGYMSAQVGQPEVVDVVVSDVE